MALTEGPASELLVEPGQYGERVVAVEPGGVEPIPDADRHGRPLQLFWTWASPNLEFATIFVGVLPILAFGLSFWPAASALLVGTLLGSITHGILSARGPAYGVPQMVLGRAAFGYWGNVLPAGLNAVVAGIGWFAVNSVSGAFALNTLTHLPAALCLVIIVLVQIAVAFFGHNLVHVFERYAFPVLAVVFAIASVVILTKAHPGATGAGGGWVAGWLLTMSAAFGYAAGWNPYATDYTRYLSPGTNRRAVGLWAGSGVLVSCLFLEVVGAASMTIGGAVPANPTGAFTSHLSTVVADLTLLAIALGAIAANVLNVYSAAMSFLTLGIRVSLRMRRALVALGFGIVGLVVAWSGLSDAGAKYESFLLVIAYWIGPWLGVVLVDQFLRRGERTADLLYDPHYRHWAGPIAMLAGILVSVPLFSNQEKFVGLVPRHVAEVGDITFLVGFAVAALVYALLFRRTGTRAARPAPAAVG